MLLVLAAQHELVAAALGLEQWLQQELGAMEQEIGYSYTKCPNVSTCGK